MASSIGGFERRRIYLDWNATTPLRAEALAAMKPYFCESYGNPSSAHALGSRARAAVEEARDTVAEVLGVKRSEVVFTSGGTESNHLALLGTALALNPGVILSTPIEHSSVLRAVDWLVERGWQVHKVQLLPDGRVDLDRLARGLDATVRLVSIGWANNEIGTLQPVAEIFALCQARGIFFHTDAVQVPGKAPFRKVPAHLLSLSGHKFGGPKGVGCLIVREEVAIRPLFRGGAQERGLRAGTENVPGIVGFASALRLAVASAEGFSARVRPLRDRLWQRLREIPGVQRHGASGEHVLPNTLMVTVDDVTADALIAALDLEGICVSAGSACAAGAAEPSHVLLALGIPLERARGAVRFSLGQDVDEAEIDFVAERFAQVVQRIRTVEHPSPRRLLA